MTPVFFCCNPTPDQPPQKVTILSYSEMKVALDFLSDIEMSQDSSVTVEQLYDSTGNAILRVVSTYPIAGRIYYDKNGEMLPPDESKVAFSSMAVGLVLKCTRTCFGIIGGGCSPTGCKVIASQGKCSSHLCGAGCDGPGSCKFDVSNGFGGERYIH